MLCSRTMRIRSTAHPIVWQRFLADVVKAFLFDRSVLSIDAAAADVIMSRDYSMDALMGHILTGRPDSRYHLVQMRDGAKVIAACAAADIRAVMHELNARENQRAVASSLGPFKLLMAARKGGGYADIFYAHLAAATYLMINMKSNPEWTLEIRSAQR